MKKQLCFGVMLGFVASSCCWYGENAKKVQCDGATWFYDVKDDAAIVRQVESTNAVLRIPDKLGGTIVRGIGRECFAPCVNLAELCIPVSVTNIKNGAFERRSDLMTVIFDGDLPDVGQYRWGVRCKWWSNPLSGCQSIFVAEDAKGCPTNGEKCLDVPLYRCRRGAVAPFHKFRDEKSGLTWRYFISNGDATLISARPSPDGTVVIPSSLNGVPVRKIGGMALKNSKKMSSVVIPASVTNIAEKAFAGCDSLRFVLFEGDAPAIHEDAFECYRHLRFCCHGGMRGWPESGKVHGQEVVIMAPGIDFEALIAKESSLPYVFQEKRDITAVGRDALKANWQLPEFEFGDDYPVKVTIRDKECWPSFLECIERPVRVDRPLLDLGIHRVHLRRNNCPLRHVWIRNEVRYPIDRETRIAEYEAIKTAIKQRYGVLGTETKRAAFFSAQWKTVFETDDVRIEVIVDPDGLSRPLTVVATDVERDRKMNEEQGGRVGVDTEVFCDDMRTGWGKTPVSDYLTATKRGSGHESRWPFDGLPFCEDIGSLGWKCAKTAAKNEIVATEDFDNLGLGISQVYAYADGESGKIFRFVAAEDLSLEAYSNVCQMIAGHYGVKGVENNEYVELRGWVIEGMDATVADADGGQRILRKAKTEFALPNQIIRLEWVNDMLNHRFLGKRFSIEVDDVGRFAALREAFLKRFENDRLEKFSFGEVRRDIDHLDEFSVVSYDRHARIKKPFRLFGRERVRITPTTHRVWCRTWYGEAFPGWMTQSDISNELQCLEKELIRLYGGSPTQDWGHAVLHAGGYTFRYGAGNCLGIEGAEFCGFDHEDRMVLSASDDALEKIQEDESFIDGYEMDKFVFGRNPPKIRVGIGTEFDFGSPVKRWTGRTETIANTDIVCRHIWTHNPGEFTAVGCCHLGDVGRGALDSTYRLSKIIIGKTYGIANPQEAVTTNGVVETSVCTFRQGDLTVTMTKKCEISGKEKTRSLTIVGETDAEKLLKGAR